MAAVCTATRGINRLQLPLSGELARAIPKLGRLFGGASLEASKSKHTPAKWRRTLRRVLHELDRYLIANVDTDELHLEMLHSGVD